MKVRGYRIEPAEVEAVMLEYEGIKQVAVVARDDIGGDPTLAGYVVTNGDTPLALGQLRAFLETRLPNYMIPTTVFQVQQMPTTVTGKIDRNALASMRQRPVEPGNYIGPRNPSEDLVARVWAEVLGIERIGIHDDFFAIGGHSLTAMRSALRLKSIVPFDVNVSALLKCRTVESVANVLSLYGSTPHRTEVGITQVEDTVRSITWLHRRPNARPVFLVHPGGGAVHWYRGLAEILSREASVAALQHPAVVDAQSATYSVEHLATKYLTEIQQVQDRGPYRLLGWCGGGPVTWEVTRRLVENGADTTVILLDPTSDVVRNSGDEPELVRLLRNSEQLLTLLQRAPNDEERAEIVARVEPVIRRAVDDFYDTQLSEDLDLVAPEWLGRVRAWRQLHEATFAYRYPSAEVGLHLILGDDLFAGSHEVIRETTLSDYLGRWLEVSKNELHLYRTSGSHLEVLTHPHLLTLADIVRHIWFG